MIKGYYRFPTVHKDKVVFVSEDDLWLVPLKGGDAVRLSSSLDELIYPHFSPDGQWIAFLGKDEGSWEVYKMPATGGVAERLTYSFNVRSSISGWSKNGNYIYYSSCFQEPFYKNSTLYKIHKNGGLPEKMNLGHGKHISFGSKNRSVIGRNTLGIERWKRYRGGTAGKLWIDDKGKGNYKEWAGVDANYNSPMWIGEQIYFISDHEGIGNIYAMKPDGSDLKKITNHTTYFCKHATTDGITIVYINGADLYQLEVASGKSNIIEVGYKSPKVQNQRKFISGNHYLQNYDLHPEGHSLLINTRGKVFNLANWEGPVLPIPVQDEVRHRLSRYFNHSEKIIYVSDEGGEKEYIEIFDKEKNKTVALKSLSIGRPVELKIAPNDKKVALSNHKGEMIIVDLSLKKVKVVDRAKLGVIKGFNWSRDSQWLSYATSDQSNISHIKLFGLDKQKVHQATEGDFTDFHPSFSFCGNYLFFLSNRYFNPVYDSVYFDLNFPRSTKPYCIVLNKEKGNPFVPKKQPFDEDNNFLEKCDFKKIFPCKIDLENLSERIVEMPIKEGNYESIVSVPEVLLFLSYPIKGSLNNHYSNAKEPSGELKIWNFLKQEEKTIVSGVSTFKMASRSCALVYRSNAKLRVLPFTPDLKPSTDKALKRKTGWIDLSRIKVQVVPAKEWSQIFNEIWRLQKQHFWTENMTGVDWKKVYKRYQPLVSRLGSRSELSDLAWEMQGELGTSHAYEIGGDYRKGRSYNIGYLGCDFIYDKKAKAYKITHIVKGDSWNPTHASPLQSPGLNLKEGDYITAVNSTVLHEHCSPYQALVNLSNQEVVLHIKPQKGKAKTIEVKTIADEQKLRYRAWVNYNRAYVHQKTKGKVGYVHLPDMGPQGYAEFHRYYAVESQKDALIVDVRFNGGGHVSQLILEKLARKHLGYDIARWAEEKYAYPSHSVIGPIVAITNEFAGSDGDIFSHAFKLMNIGTLIGRRTWGGVVGIWPRHHLIDGGVTTQPEFSYWFKDVGFGVENYGTDPDIFVDISPQDYKANKDMQLDKAILEIGKDLKSQKPAIPDFGPKPDLSLPS